VHCGVDCVLTVDIIIKALKYSNAADVFFKSHRFSGVTYFIPEVHYNKTIALPIEQQFKNKTRQGNRISINPCKDFFMSMTVLLEQESIYI
jgi:hypothetical protein